MLKPGDEIDIWVVEKALGQGGMGSVYRCHNRNAKRILAAVKVLDPTLNRIASAQARFIREAEILFALDHPNIVKVRNVRMDAELPYLEMEFVSGQNLEDRIVQGPMSLEAAVSLLKQAADALVYMHDSGIRHRDIKPSNMIVQDDDALKLVDFGIATEQDGKTITESGQNFGSVSYAPPEWIEPDSLDPVKWDIYSLGVVFFEVLTGRFGFPVSGIGTSRQKALQVMVAKQNHAPLDPGPSLPVGLRALTRAMTRARPEDRLASAAEVLAALEALDLEHIDPEHSFGDEPVERPTAPTWYPGMMENSGETMVPDVEALEAAREAFAEPVAVPAPEPARAPPDPVPVSAAPELPEPQELSPKTAPLGHIEAEEEAPAGSTPMLPYVAAFAAILVLILIGAWWSGRREPDQPIVFDRAVDVVVAGLPADSAPTVLLSGEAPTSSEGLVFHFAPRAPGPAKLEVVQGVDCVPDAAWCSRHLQAVAVEAGPGPQTVGLTLEPLAPRAVALTAPKLGGAALVRFGEVEAEIVDGKGSVELMPGNYGFLAQAGTCDSEARACWPDCPAGCASLEGELLVSVAGEVELELPIEVQKRSSSAAGTPSTGADNTNTTGVQAAATAAKAPISYGQFAAWLSKHPEWQGGAAIEAGKADANYLKGWDGATPPSGKDGHAVVNVSWSAANAFCSSRGGLAALEAEPTTWSEGASAAWHEYRQNQGAPSWRRSDGGVSTTVKRAETATFIGFRCAR